MLAKEKKLASVLASTTTLVAVKISQWSARKLDRKVTSEINTKYHAGSDAGRYNKLLIDGEHLAKLNSIVSAARSLHYSMTRPWADEGFRILPNALYTKFAEQFRPLKREFAKEADAFAYAYPKYIEERAKKLNGLFNPDDYPRPSEIRSKFHLDTEFMAFPDASDFRSDLPDEIVEDIRKEITEASGRAVDAAMQATAQEVVEKVGHMAEKLKSYSVGTDGKRDFFADSLVGNVRELAELLPAFNLTNDPNFDRIAKRIAQELCSEEPKALRKNEAARASVAKSADEIVAEMSKFLA